MMHEIVIDKADSGLIVEFFPVGLQDQKVLLLLDYERMPTYKKYQFAALAGDDTNTTSWKTEGGINIVTHHLSLIHI